MESDTSAINAQITKVEVQIAKHEEELGRLRTLLQRLEEGKAPIQNGDTVIRTEEFHDAESSRVLKQDEPTLARTLTEGSIRDSTPTSRFPLELEEYARYGRQLILPEVGLEGQLRLKGASVLIVGAGGLGCPAAAYLAGAGVGHIGLIDGDIVETSNLHRQILHATSKVGMTKVASVKKFIEDLNPLIKVTGYETHLTPTDAIDIVDQYDLVLDCTDTPASRYLISDACVLLGKPLVSASALKTEGQLMVLNYPASRPGDPLGGPCYRCVFPQPPPAETVVSCGEGGILGPVVGLMGVLQALEAIKVIIGGDTVRAAAGPAENVETLQARQHSLLLFSAFGSPQFRSIKLRGRKANCAACSSTPSITVDSLRSGSLDYIQFCGITNPVNLLASEDRTSATDAAKALKEEDTLLIDVRERTQFYLCNIDGSVNVPFSKFPPLTNKNESTFAARAKLSDIKDFLEECQFFEECQEGQLSQKIIVICRQGNDSQVVVRHLQNLLADQARSIHDVAGGLIAWRRDVDPEFPVY